MVRNVINLLKKASAGVRESASCIVVQKIANKSYCSKNIFDYRLLFVKRHQKLKSWPGALTFPGGVIDKEESAYAKNFSQITKIDELSLSPPSEIEYVYRKTALRELIEETEFPLDTDIESLIPWSIWQTPLSIPRRFNTIFFLVFVGSVELDLKPRKGEIESLHWLSPAEILSDSSVYLAPVTVADVSKFSSHPRYDQLIEFSKQRYQNHQTIQCMPVMIQLKNGLVGINPADSFYPEALELQLKDTSQWINIDCTVEEHCAAQEVLCREIIVSESGNRKIMTSALWDGHKVSDATYNSKIMQR
jgi:8-oxo-dGTP pyrophosphatase MutT (NUDIX family)